MKLTAQMMKQQSPGKNLPLPKTSDTTESYTHLVVNKSIAASTFDTSLPKGMKTMAMPTQQEYRPPVSLGSPAPNLQVTSMNGKTVSLSSLKGKVVLLDFWATWCPPCRKGLPETQKLNEEYGSKGRVVMAISNEKKETVQPFLQQNKYTFPAYLDTTRSGDRVYHIKAIPTT